MGKGATIGRTEFLSCFEANIYETSDDRQHIFYRGRNDVQVSCFEIKKNVPHRWYIFHCYRSSQPLFLGGLVMYFSQNDDTPNDQRISKAIACLYAVGIAACSFCSVFSLHPFTLFTMELGMRIRQSACSMIYRKVFSPQDEAEEMNKC